MQLNQPLIQFPLRWDSPIRNDYINIISSSQVGNEGNQIEVGMDDYLRDMTTMDAMLLYSFQNDELGDDAHIIDTLFESLKASSTTPLFGPGGKSKYIQLGAMMLLYTVKEKFGKTNACFSTILM